MWKFSEKAERQIIFVGHSLVERLQILYFSPTKQKDLCCAPQVHTFGSMDGNFRELKVCKGVPVSEDEQQSGVVLQTICVILARRSLNMH
jgi:hypothetical protein